MYVTVKILFFGATAEIVGTREIFVKEIAQSKASKLIEKVIGDYPKLASGKLLFSVNQQHATGDEIIRDGDEVAIFTAVSGG